MFRNPLQVRRKLGKIGLWQLLSYLCTCGFILCDLQEAQGGHYDCLSSCKDVRKTLTTPIFRRRVAEKKNVTVILTKLPTGMVVRWTISLDKWYFIFTV
jgi:hypothetical protein